MGWRIWLLGADGEQDSDCYQNWQQHETTRATFRIIIIGRLNRTTVIGIQYKNQRQEGQPIRTTIVVMVTAHGYSSSGGSGSGPE